MAPTEASGAYIHGLQPLLSSNYGLYLLLVDQEFTENHETSKKNGLFGACVKRKHNLPLFSLLLCK